MALQTNTEDELTAAIQRLTHRRVVAFLGANQTTPGVACELCFLDAAPSPPETVQAERHDLRSTGRHGVAGLRP